MRCRRGVGVAAAGTAVAATLVALMTSLLRRLPPRKHVTVDGVTTIADAVAACRRTRLHGWELVGYAQLLAARKFTHSRLNTWDSPTRAFERGMGYCQQQALALRQVYDQLGIEVRPVYALRCKFPPAMIDGMPWLGGITPHTWLRVQLAGEERDVCPGSVNNRPGVTHFVVLSHVRTLHAWLRPFSALGSSIANIQRDRAARRGLHAAQGKPVPS